MDLHNKEILVIEDDKHIFALIEAMLKPYNVNLVLETDGQSGLNTALEKEYDLILLDIMLPQKDGWEVCRELKESGKDTPIIILTAKAEETDKVLGLEIGADDYVTKPFSPRELIARIKAVLRRFIKNRQKKSDDLVFEDIGLIIKPDQFNIKVKGKQINLTPKEFELLNYLAKNEEQVFTREQLLDQIWGFDNYTGTRTVDEHIKRLRKKLSRAGFKESPLITVWGIGYKFSSKEACNES